MGEGSAGSRVGRVGGAGGAGGRVLVSVSSNQRKKGQRRSAQVAKGRCGFRDVVLIRMAARFWHWQLMSRVLGWWMVGVGMGVRGLAVAVVGARSHAKYWQ